MAGTDGLMEARACIALPFRRYGLALYPLNHAHHPAKRLLLGRGFDTPALLLLSHPADWRRQRLVVDQPTPIVVCAQVWA